MLDLLSVRTAPSAGARAPSGAGTGPPY